MSKKGSKWIVRIMIIEITLILLAVGKLVSIYLGYQKGNDTYDELLQYVEEPDEKMNGDTKQAPDTDNQAEVRNPYLQVDFAGLKAVNPDIIAWIQIPALDISYPVVLGNDKDYYLYHLFDGKKNINGSIFVDYHNQPDFVDSNTIVYGHNMKNGSLFGTLDRY